MATESRSMNPAQLAEYYSFAHRTIREAVTIPFRSEFSYEYSAGALAAAYKDVEQITLLTSTFHTPPEPEPVEVKRFIDHAVTGYCKVTLAVAHQFASLNAARDAGFNPSKIRRVISGKEITHRDCLWRLPEEDPPGIAPRARTVPAVALGLHSDRIVAMIPIILEKAGTLGIRAMSRELKVSTTTIRLLLSRYNQNGAPI